MPASRRGRSNILKPCPMCGNMRGRMFDLPRIDDGSGGRTILMPGGGMILESRLCSCPKGERPFFRIGGRGPGFYVDEDREYRILEDRRGITAACRVCFHQECGECFCEDLAIVVCEDGVRTGERIRGNSLLIERCRTGRFWVDKIGTIMRGLQRIFGVPVEVADQGDV